jgi:ABC-type Na+ efflux pump permease subunit
MGWHLRALERNRQLRKVTTASTALDKRVDAALFLPLLVPVFVPAMLAAFGIAGEREQGTLEPVLTTPVRRTELVAGKSLAIFLPSLVISYAMFGVFFAVTQRGTRGAARL